VRTTTGCATAFLPCGKASETAQGQTVYILVCQTLLEDAFITFHHKFLDLPVKNSWKGTF
jgi:hypothetical protein